MPCAAVIPLARSANALRRPSPVKMKQNKKNVFSRTCAGKRHLKSRERGDRKGANGGKREGERSEQESVVPRQKKEGANGGENARTSHAK